MKLAKEKATEFNRINQIVALKLSQMQIILPYKDLGKEELKEDIKYIKKQLNLMEALLE
jgi:hypothetical protein